VLRRAGGEKSGAPMLGIDMEKASVFAARGSKGGRFCCQIDFC
jgi:hypothetical protein